MNYLQEIRSTSLEVVHKSKDVFINDEEIQRLIGNDEVFPIDIQKSLEKIQWDSEGWHYCSDAEARGPLTAQYIFVLDALNFCFWPCAGFEYVDLAVNLKTVFEKDFQQFSAESLSQMSEERLRSWFPGWDIPLLSERVKRLREIGWGLQEYDGLAINLVKRSNNSANKLVDLVLKSFPGFRDTIVYEGTLVHFYKRAQILVGDLWGAYGKPTDPLHPFYFADLQDITMFADYRVPQILLHVGILKYSDPLLQKILSHEVIPFGSNWETEIRAATVIAVERIREMLRSKKNLSLLSIEIDWILWNWGEKVKDSIHPHHKTLTVYY